jgi:hypothetical protein
MDSKYQDLKSQHEEIHNKISKLWKDRNLLKEVNDNIISNYNNKVTLYFKKLLQSTLSLPCNILFIKDTLYISTSLKSPKNDPFLTIEFLVDETQSNLETRYSMYQINPYIKPARTQGAIDTLITLGDVSKKINKNSNKIISKLNLEYKNLGTKMLSKVTSPYNKISYKIFNLRKGKGIKIMSKCLVYILNQNKKIEFNGKLNINNLYTSIDKIELISSNSNITNLKLTSRIHPNSDKDPLFYDIQVPHLQSFLEEVINTDVNHYPIVKDKVDDFFDLIKPIIED